MGMFSDMVPDLNWSIYKHFFTNSDMVSDLKWRIPSLIGCPSWAFSR